MNNARLLPLFIILLLCLPYFLALPLVDFSTLDFDLGEIGWGLRNSLVQAFVSAFFAVVLGLGGALGLMSGRRGLEPLLLLPTLLPSLFLIIALFALLPQFPMGLPGITIANVLTYFGFVALNLAQVLQEKLAKFSEVALVLGVRRPIFLLRIALPLIKLDLFISFLFVFASCFSSFTIPLFFGGGTTSTLEVLIYEKMRASSNWSLPYLLSLLQSSILYGVLIWQYFNSNRPLESLALSSRRSFRTDLLQSSGLRWSYILVLSLFFASYLKSMVLGAIRGPDFIQLLGEMAEPILSTFFIAMGTGGLTAVCLICILYCLPHKPLDAFLTGFIAPSPVIACFGFLLWGSNAGFMWGLKLMILLTLLYLAAFFRLGVQSKFKSLWGQIQVARTLGARHSLIFSQVILPQMISRIFMVSGVAGTWAAGEFAVSKILASRDFTLALQIRSLLSSYRIELAGALSFILILLSLAAFAIFLGVGRVLDSKS